MGNIVAQLALLVWLPFSLWIGSVMSAPRAVATIMIGAAMFLPERVGYDLPLLPALDKHTVASLSALAACAANHSRTAFTPRKSRAVGWLVVICSLSVVLTVTNNFDALRFGPTTLPGLSPQDLINSLLGTLIRFVLPFYLGQALFRTTDDLRILLRGLALGGLIYVPLVLFEARMAPILHSSLYGFFQHEFAQAMRAGGFRAFVFMSHGLTVALFMSQALTTTVALERAKVTLLPVSNRLLTIILAGALASCKTMGAILYAGVTLPLIWFTKPKTQLRVASWLVLLVIAYPLARFYDLIPTDAILAEVTKISADRAQSLEFRFDQEQALLSRALLRPYFGWGGWGRNRVYDSFGNDLSTPDGEWILALGCGGVLWFAVWFGLLLMPVLLAKKAAAKVKLGPEDAQILATSALLMAFTGLDLIPNSLSHHLPTLLAGGLWCTSVELMASRRRGAGLTRESATPGRPSALSRAAI